jgi:hypothetical protein
MQLYVATHVLRHGVANRDSLRACSNGIRGILDVGAGDDGAAGQEQGAADVEVGVWAFSCDVLVAMEVSTFAIGRRSAWHGLRANGDVQ